LFLPAVAGASVLAFFPPTGCPRYFRLADFDNRVCDSGSRPHTANARLRAEGSGLALLLVRELGAYLFDAPGWTALVELALFTNERGGCARKDPYVIVGGCLPIRGAIIPVTPPSSGWRTKSVALRFVPPIVNGTSPAGLMETRISRGLSVGATKEGFVSGWRVDETRLASEINHPAWSRSVVGRERRAAFGAVVTR
jgi:hypothetical protein